MDDAIIKVEGLVKVFAGKVPVRALDGLDLTVERGGVYGELVDTGTTVLLTTQYLEEADQLAHRIAVIDHGRLVSEGTPDQLKDQVGGAVLELTVPDDDRAQALSTLQTMQAEDPTDDQHRGRIVL